MSRIERSKWNGACEEKRSLGVRFEHLGAPVDEAHPVLVREHHALGLARRAGGVEDVREVGATRPDRLRLPAPLPSHPRRRARVAGLLRRRPQRRRSSVGTDPAAPARRRSFASKRLSMTIALTAQLCRMYALRAGGAPGSTGTYAAPALRMP